MKKTTVTVLVVLACAASLLLAQAPPPPPDPAMHVQHHVEFLTTVLNLTAAQQQQATTIFTNVAKNATAFHDSMKAARQTLDTAVQNNDASGIEQAAAAIGNLTAQMTVLHAKVDAAFNQILTPDQQAKLKQLHKEGPGHGFGHMGPGPFPGAH